MSRRRKFILASVLALQNSSFIYPSCQKCLSRIILVSNRSNCLKCGSTGEIENVRYRYKLPLKVAESNRLFAITVFGSCLDTFFGLTATGLHSYLQDSDGIPETLNSTAVQNLLTKAVEASFVGRSFIFGVTNFKNHYGHSSDASNFRKQFFDQNKEVRELVACQILLPDPGVQGFTVFDYFCQLLDFKKHRCDSQACNSYLLALEHSDSDLSNIDGSDKSSCLSGYHSRKVFSRSWQLSLELISVNSQPADNDDDDEEEEEKEGFLASEPCKAIGTHHKHKMCPSLAKVTNSDSYSSAIQGSWSFISYMDKKGLTQKLDEALDLQSVQPSAVQSCHEIEVNNSQLFPLKIQECPETRNTKSFHDARDIKIRYSPLERTAHQHHDVDIHLSFQGRSSCCTPSSFRLEEKAHGSQNCDSEIWDELPFSESLNKFLAAVESEIATSQPDAKSGNCNLDSDTDKLHAHYSRSSVTPKNTRALRTPPVSLRLSQATVKASSSKDNNLSYCEANPSPSIQMDSPRDNTAEIVSKSSIRRDISNCFLPNPYLSAAFSSSEDLRTRNTPKYIKIPPHRPEISHMHSTSENDHTSLNIRYFNEPGEISHLEMSENLATFHSKRYSDVSDLCDLKRLKNQGNNFTICRKLTYPLEDLCSSSNRCTNTLKEMPCEHISTNLTQNCSGHEGSYNASADLFDDNNKEIDMATEITKQSQDTLLQWGTSLSESPHMESEFSPKPLSENFSQSSQKSLENKSASLYSRTCFSPPYFHSDSEYEFEDSQDFVPCSQSTPLAGFHRTRIQGMKGTSKILPNFFTGLDTNYRKTNISSQNYMQQAIPSCPEAILTLKQKSESSLTQPEVSNNCPITGCLETDIDECVPPSTKKVFPSEMFGFQVLGKRCLTSCHSNQKELPMKKLKYVKQRTKKCLIKRELSLKTVTKALVTKQKTHIRTRAGGISRESVLGHDACLEVSRYLPCSEKWLLPVPETNSAWSPELF
ncbi:DNA damage-induced apoptosis suppressor protein [Sorex fumeus]|uniref:DNA damage-induced apoptosis suppressor protein n=1 Tax=Sorex fumeus TaxID=62283 RepID=UPI0024AD1833|nr:DNA damage-induced apoptosis suppressor protein [Sorex fumeus]XP_055972154.1 DNA damage-induced apoptosis suppressor protein [Sorex fumeus]